MIMVVFTQYCTSIGTCLDLDETGTPALDLLAVDLPFTCCLLYVIDFPTGPVACTAECLTS